MKVILYQNENEHSLFPHVFSSVDQLKRYFLDQGIPFPTDTEDAHILKLLEAEGNQEYVGSHFWFASREVR